MSCDGAGVVLGELIQNVGSVRLGREPFGCRGRISKENHLIFKVGEQPVSELLPASFKGKLGGNAAKGT
jgi:hypothetical protein